MFVVLLVPLMYVEYAACSKWITEMNLVVQYLLMACIFTG